ncbi:MAG TPA: hypothetical protein VLU99_05105, partial [Nitrososphaerales archaeon]|nr:hypothetical protein [Nitrososphaerales archaeon]
WLQYALTAVAAVGVVLVLALPGIASDFATRPPVPSTTTTPPVSFANSTIEAFAKVPALYSSLGYPAVDYGGYPKVNYSQVDCPSFTPPQVMGLSQAIGIAVSYLGLDPSNYSFAAAQFSPGNVPSCSQVDSPLWGLSFARAYGGFWVYGPDGPSGPLPVSITVDAVRGTVLRNSTDLSSLPTSGTYQLKIGSSVALATVKASKVNATVSGRTYPLAANGTVTSEQPRIALLGPSASNAAFMSPLNASLSGQRRLCWILALSAKTSSDSYQGTFVVDAETGELVSYSTSGAPNT